MFLPWPWTSAIAIMLYTASIGTITSTLCIHLDHRGPSWLSYADFKRVLCSYFARWKGDTTRNLERSCHHYWKHYRCCIRLARRWALFVRPSPSPSILITVHVCSLPELFELYTKTRFLIFAVIVAILVYVMHSSLKYYSRLRHEAMSQRRSASMFGLTDTSPQYENLDNGHEGSRAHVWTPAYEVYINQGIAWG